MTKLADKIKEGAHISVLTGHATAHCALATSMVHGTIEATTPKALKIRADTVNGKQLTAWLPRKALVNDISETADINCRLAKWFTPQGWTARFLDLATHHSLLSA